MHLNRSDFDHFQQEEIRKWLEKGGLLYEK